jgi:hypothetical protein
MSMFDLTQLSDDDLRAALFDALVDRLEAEAREDPSIALVNRMPTVFSVSRQGNLLTLSQGLGLWLLRGVLKWKDRHEGLRTFNVGRASIQSRLAITPDGISGTPEETLDWIVAMFLERTGESRPAVAEPTPEHRSAASRPVRKSRPAPVEVTPSKPIEAPEAGAPRPHMADKPKAPEVAPPRPAPALEKEKATPSLRTYQLLFEIAQRELKVAKALPADSARFFLISAGVSVAFTAEAFFNDLGSRVISSWGQLQRLDPREKAEVLNIELFNDKVNWSVSPFQSVAAALGFRRALAHAHAETLPFEQTPIADRSQTEVPRTRRTAWQEHCDIPTIERWVTDVRLLIELFSRGHDPTEVAVGTAEPPSVNSSNDAGTRKKLRRHGVRGQHENV